MWYHYYTHSEPIEEWFNKYDRGNWMQANVSLLGSDVGKHRSATRWMQCVLCAEKAITSVFLARSEGLSCAITNKGKVLWLAVCWDIMQPPGTHQIRTCPVILSTNEHVYGDLGSNSIILEESQTKEACVYCYSYEWTFTAYDSRTL